MKKILTITIPTYNMQEYLPRCIDSLLENEDVIPYLDIIIVMMGARIGH